jgi:hypothetical protein
MTTARRVFPHIETDPDGTFDSRYYTKSEVDTLLASISAATHDHNDLYFTEAEVTTLLTGKSDTSHLHDDRYFTEAETNALLAAKAALSHTHDDRYFTEAEVTASLAGKSDTGHTHAWSSVTGKPTTHTSNNTITTLTNISTTTVTSLAGTSVGPLVSGQNYLIDARLFIEAEGIGGLCDAIPRISFGGSDAIAAKRSRWEQGVDSERELHHIFAYTGTGSTLAVTGQIQRVSGTPGTLDVERSRIVVIAYPVV